MFMRKRSIVSSLIVATLVLGVCWLWNKGTFTNSGNMEEARLLTGNNETSGRLPDEGEPKTLDDLLAQAEETHLPKVDTAGWQTYRDEKLGIEFMYPKGWEVEKYAVDQGFSANVCMQKKNTMGDDVECTVQIDKLQISEDQRVQDILSSKVLFPDNKLRKIVFPHFTGLAVIQGDGSIQEGSPHILFKFNGSEDVMLVGLTYSSTDKYYEDVLNGSRGILQTLKPIQK